MLVCRVIAILVQTIVDGNVLIINTMISSAGLLRLLCGAFSSTGSWVLSSRRLGHIFLSHQTIQSGKGH